MRFLSKFTLAQVLFCALFLVAILMVFAYSIAMRASSDALLFASDKLQDEVGADLSRRMEDYFGAAENAIDAFGASVDSGAIRPDQPLIRAALYSLILSHPSLSELTFTSAIESGRDENGAVIVAPRGRNQIQLSRVQGKLAESQVLEKGGAFIKIQNDGTHTPAPDPTKHPTFRTPSLESFEGDTLWSDLHWAEGSKAVVVTVQKAIYDGNDRFLGVLRAGLDYEQVGRITASRIANATRSNPGYIFILDTEKRFITGFGSQDEIVNDNGPLRLSVKDPPEEVRAVLNGLNLKNLGDVIRGTQLIGGEPVSYTFRKVPHSRDWVIGTLVKTGEVLAPVTRSRDLGRMVSMLLLLLSGTVGVLVLRTLKSFLEEMIEESSRLNQFRFEGSVPVAPFRDLLGLAESFDRTKAALRTMSKYASVDLVRDLYLSRKEALLGAESRELTVLFSDIKDFTAITENSTPNELATRLGIYFGEMIEILQKKHFGTVDKFIGDALLVFWNAPHNVPEHPQQACEAALLCREVTHQLSRRHEWGAFPEFVTRFGIHTDTVLVGHFGARERMNYGVLGDGVNLASRLESLNKYFGTSILVSDATRQRAAKDLVYREIDEVAVKGREKTNRIFELVGRPVNLAPQVIEVCLRYEEALALYRAGNFAAAVNLLAKNAEDLPSQKLRMRCAVLAESAPKDWEPVLRIYEK